MQKIVGLRRPVSGYDLDGAATAGRRLNFADDIKEHGVNRANLACSEIPQKRINFSLFRATALSGGVQNF
jgi:hypothetical protein